MNYVKQISVPDVIIPGAMSRFIDHEGVDSESDSGGTVKFAKAFLQLHNVTSWHLRDIIVLALKCQLNTRLERTGRTDARLPKNQDSRMLLSR